MGRSPFRAGGPAAAVGVLWVAFLLRAPITSVPPVLASIRESLGLSAAAAGATTSMPLVCFGLFAFLTPVLVARLGLERTIPVVLVPLTAGLALRGAGAAWVFFVGTLLVGIGIAVGNVVVPAVIRTRFPGRVAVLLGAYTATLQVSGALGSAVTAPLVERAGWPWQAAVGVWTVPAVLAVLWWLPLLRGARDGDRGPTPTGLAGVVTRPLTWIVTVFMGLQSLVYYSLVTWLPEHLSAAGHGPSAAALLLGLLSLLGLPGAFVGPRFARSAHSVPFVAATFVAMAGGVALLGCGTALSAVGVVLCGLAQGAAFSTAMTFVADQPHAQDVAAVSAFAQGTGYVLAATGPVALGAVFSATGSWRMPDLLLIGCIAVLGLLGCVAGPRLRAAHAAVTGAAADNADLPTSGRG